MDKLLEHEICVMRSQGACDINLYRYTYGLNLYSKALSRSNDAKLINR